MSQKCENCGNELSTNDLARLCKGKCCSKCCKICTRYFQCPECKRR